MKDYESTLLKEINRIRDKEDKSLEITPASNLDNCQKEKLIILQRKLDFLNGQLKGWRDAKYK